MKGNQILLCITLCFSLSGFAAAAEDNVHFSGALVSEPCTVPDADKDIKLEFGDIIKKALNEYGRTISKPFFIHLENCDPSIMDSVSVMFQGNADSELPDMLAIDTTGSAKGVAIGLELEDGTPLAINKSSPSRQINSGSNVLGFNAYVSLLPTAKAGNTLVAGNFSAVTNFVLQYQ